VQTVAIHSFGFLFAYEGEPMLPQAHQHKKASTLRVKHYASLVS